MNITIVVMTAGWWKWDAITFITNEKWIYGIIICTPKSVRKFWIGEIPWQINVFRSNERHLLALIIRQKFFITLCEAKTRSNIVNELFSRMNHRLCCADFPHQWSIPKMICAHPRTFWKIGNTFIAKWSTFLKSFDHASFVIQILKRWVFRCINIYKLSKNCIFFFAQTTNISALNFHKITGLACSSNRTLSFLSMDSLNYGLVAEKLGISLKHAVHSTIAVIIDSQVLIWTFHGHLFTFSCRYSNSKCFTSRMSLPTYLNNR